MSALRYNTGKNMLSLIPTELIEEVGKVLSYGANKYTVRDGEGNITIDGRNNWRRGLKWTSVIDSLDRHLLAFKKGEDIDQESQLYHLSHCVVNIAFLLSYYKTHPELDDRHHMYLNHPKIGLDIDEIICDWVTAWCKKFDYKTPSSWSFSYDNHAHFNNMSNDEINEFYSSIPRKIEPLDLPFEPHCYITSRSVSLELTKKWIQNNGFPTVPVYSVPFGASKIDVAKSSGIDWFIDDSFKNFEELNNAGICTFLMTTLHNERYNVGYRRIKDFKDFKERFLCQ